LIFGEKSRILSSLLCSFLHPQVTSSLLGPNIHLSTLFSNTFNQSPSLNFSDQLSHPYKTRQNFSSVCLNNYHALVGKLEDKKILQTFLNPLTPELNPSAQRCLTRFFTGDFVSWTVNFVNICVKNKQIHLLFIQFINYVW
jgi:hypothetical protein